MKKTVTLCPWYPLLIFALFMVYLAIFHPVPHQRAEAEAVVIIEGPELAEYRSHVRKQMRLLTSSGCFRRADFCQDAAQRIVNHTEPGLTVEQYRSYVTEELDDLWEIQCLKKTEGCQPFVARLPDLPATATTGGE